MQITCTCGCLMLHKMLHEGFFFLLVAVLPQPTSTCLYWGRPGKTLPRAQHPRRMEPTGDFALKRGSVGKGESVPIAELGSCSVRADAPRGQLAAERRALHLDPPVERLWVKRFTRPKSSDIFCGGG